MKIIYFFYQFLLILFIFCMVEGKSEFERQKEIAKMKRLRHESFLLNPKQLNNLDEELNKLDETDVQNNNYLSSSTTQPTAASYVTGAVPNIPEKILEQEKEESFEESTHFSANDRKRTISDSSTVSTSPSTSSKPVRYRSLSDIKRDFELSDVIQFVHNGLESIIDDEVTKRFTTEELTVWNLLSRTNQQYEYVSFRVTVLWILGFVLRYLILFPFRLV
jgi:hypothetical protein